MDKCWSNIGRRFHLPFNFVCPVGVHLRAMLDSRRLEMEFGECHCLRKRSMSERCIVNQQDSIWVDRLSGRFKGDMGFTSDI